MGAARSNAEPLPRQLYDLIVARLRDLKLELEGGDSSNADMLIRSPIETEHRKYVSNWLRDKSQPTPSVRTCASIRRGSMALFPRS
jgi:hypothetical protein